ncbi:immunity 49 family protein [Nocardiopsis alkaliphila]|uniref:immunity 49 family protein n=1 Tax=Nocardiopsis alkaliphila TaxID=225762 RepID=UPI00034A3F44|nr:immunity 49 family protein [Nocardiopsis alkaliphila]
MTVRVERHKVNDEAIAKAVEDFADRLGGDVRMQQESGRDGFGWEMIARDLQDYAGARSVTDPRATADIRAALYSAAEARVGALMLDGAPPSAEFSVHLTYTGTGVFYQDHTDQADEEEGNGQRPVAPFDWAQALYLCVISDLHENYEGPLVQLASTFAEERVLHRALAFYVYPALGADREQLVGYVESALAPFFASLGRKPGDHHPDLGSVDSDLLFLHALLSRNEEAFWATMAARLAWFRDNDGEDALRSLLPVAELAFAALAVRVEGWEMPLESDYLPRYLIEGRNGTEGPRVGPYGADKDPAALAELSRGPLVVERPTEGFSKERTVEDMFEHEDKELDAIWRPEILRDRIVDALRWARNGELMSFRHYSVVDPQARHPRQLAALTHASQYATAAFACAAAKGDTVEVTIGETTAPMRTFEPTSDTSEGDLWMAVEYALLSGSRERLETLLAHPEGIFQRRQDRGSSVFARYGVAFLAYLRSEQGRGADGSPEPRVRAAMDEALTALAAYDTPGSPPPPVLLLSQLIAQDPEGFDLALADRLEEHREAYGIGHRAQDSDGLIDFHGLALACSARAKGWEVRVESDYLPQGVLERAAGMFDRP